MSKNNIFFLKNILEHILLIEESAGKLTKDEFQKNLDIQHATLRRIEVIGEAVKNISLEIKQKHSEIEWKKIAGTRDMLIHAYFRVDNDLVWDIIKRDIPKLKVNIAHILSILEDQDRKK